MKEMSLSDMDLIIIATHMTLANRLFLLQLHTSELDDGYDWNRLNLKSVTEENTLDEFLATAELAGTEFTAGE